MEITELMLVTLFLSPIIVILIEAAHHYIARKNGSIIFITNHSGLLIILLIINLMWVSIMSIASGEMNIFAILTFFYPIMILYGLTSFQYITKENIVRNRFFSKKVQSFKEIKYVEVGHSNVRGRYNYQVYYRVYFDESDFVKIVLNNLTNKQLKRLDDLIDRKVRFIKDAEFVKKRIFVQRHVIQKIVSKRIRY